jgi:hypothetical protein
MSEQLKVAVVYYSSTGTVYKLAKSIVEGAEKAGAEVRLRKVHELAPDGAIAAIAAVIATRTTNTKGDARSSDDNENASAEAAARLRSERRGAPAIQGPGDHTPGQRGLGREGHLRRYPGRPAATRVPGPARGQVQLRSISDLRPVTAAVQHDPEEASIRLATIPRRLRGRPG